MKYVVHVEQGEEGGYRAVCPEMGLSASGLGASNALDAMRDEIRYRLELCPCTSVDDAFVQLDVM